MNQVLKFVKMLIPFMLSCQGKEPEQTIIENINKTTEACRLMSFSFPVNMGYGDYQIKKTKTMSFEYDDSGRPIRVKTEENESKTSELSEISYDDSGRLSQIRIAPSNLNQNKGVKATYIYSPNNRLIEIRGEGLLNTRRFEYNEKGQIIKQLTLHNESPYMSANYSYDENGAPVKVSMKNKKEELMSDFELSFDDKMNPLKDKGLASSSGLMLGHPVGTHSNNILTNKRIDYGKNPKGKTDRIRYEYNEFGYPVRFTQGKGDKAQISTMTYNCN